MSTRAALCPRRHLIRAFLLCLLAWRLLCKEEGGVKVSSFTFNGTKAVTPGQLKSVLATAASSKIPWGTEALFQPRAVRGRPQAHRRVLQRPRLSRRARDVVRRQAERRADVGQHHGQHRGGRAGPRRAGHVQRVRAAARSNIAARSSELPLKAGQPLDRALGCRRAARPRSTSSRITAIPTRR